MDKSKALEVLQEWELIALNQNKMEHLKHFMTLQDILKGKIKVPNNHKREAIEYFQVNVKDSPKKQIITEALHG